MKLYILKVLIGDDLKYEKVGSFKILVWVLAENLHLNLINSLSFNVPGFSGGDSYISTGTF